MKEVQKTEIFRRLSGKGKSNRICFESDLEGPCDQSLIVSPGEVSGRVSQTNYVSRNEERGGELWQTLWSGLCFFLKKVLLLKLLMLAIYSLAYYLNFGWMIQRYEFAFDGDRNVFISSRSCQIVISDSFDFSEIRVQALTRVAFDHGSHADARSNHFWVETSGDHSNCLIKVPVKKAGMSFNISCSEDCVIWAFNANRTESEDLYIFSSNLNLKMKNFLVKNFFATASEIIVQGKDVSAQNVYLSAESIYFRLTFTELSPNFHLGYIPGSLNLLTNIIASPLKTISLGEFIRDFYHRDCSGFDLSSAGMFSLSPSQFESQPIEYMCFSPSKTDCVPQKHTLAYLAKKLNFTFLHVDLETLDESEYVRELRFWFLSEYEYLLTKAALQVTKNRYFVITLTNLNFRDLTFFKMIAYKGNLLPFAAHNFLQITSESDFAEESPVEKVSLVLSFSHDPILLENLSLSTQVQFYQKLKEFVVQKLETLTGDRGWKVIIADPFLMQSDQDPSLESFSSELVPWIAANSLILIFACVVASMIFVRVKRRAVRLVKREVTKFEQNERFVQQVANEGYMFSSLAEITESTPPDFSGSLSVPNNFFVLSRVVRQFLNIEYPILESDFVKHITEFQPAHADNRIELSKIFTAYHMFIASQGITTLSNNQEELAEALESAGLSLEASHSEPEFRIVGRKIVGLQRGNLFKGKLFLSMNPNFNSLEYFIRNHCKTSKKDADSISLSEFGSAYSVFCRSTSCTKQAINELNLKEEFGLIIRRVPQVLVKQGRQSYDSRFVSLKIDLIESILKGTSETKVIGFSGSLSSQTNFGRFLAFLLLMNLLELFFMNAIVSLTHHFRLLFDQKLIPYSFALTYDEFNLSLSFQDSSTYGLMLKLMFLTPVLLSDLSFISGYLFHLSSAKNQTLKKLSNILMVLLIMTFSIGVCIAVLKQVLEFFMLFFSSYIGKNHAFYFTHTVYKIAFSFAAFFYADRSIKKAKTDLKALIDLHFSELIDRHVSEKVEKTNLLGKELQEEEDKAVAIVDSWVERSKRNMKVVIQDTHLINELSVQIMMKPLSQSQLAIFFTNALEMPREDPMIELYLDLMKLKTEKISKSDLTILLDRINFSYFLVISKGDDQIARFISSFYLLYIASQSQQKDLLLASCKDLFKSIVRKEQHLVVESFVPTFVEICYSDILPEFPNENFCRLNRYLGTLGLQLTPEISQVLNYLTVDVQTAPRCLRRPRSLPVFSVCQFWKPISSSFDSDTLSCLREKDRDLERFFTDLFPERLSPLDWSQLIFSYAKLCRVDQDLLKFFCELLTTSNSREVNYTQASINCNPYFKALKRKFNTSAVMLSGAVNVSRMNFNSESSAIFVMNLFRRSEGTQLALQFQFVHLLFNRKPILSHFIRLLNVLEPRLFHYCLTSKSLSLFRAYELYTQSRIYSKDLLAFFTREMPVKNFSNGNFEEVKKHVWMEDPNLFKFFEIFELFLNIRNFNFDVGIKNLISITPLLRDLSEEDQLQLKHVISAIQSVKSRSKSDYLSAETVEAVRLLSTLANFDQTSVSDLEKNFGFLVNEKVSWEVIHDFLCKFFCFQVKMKSSSSAPLPATIIEYFTSEVKHSRLFKQILIQLKVHLSPLEQSELSSIDFDETSFSLQSKLFSDLTPYSLDLRSFKTRIRNLIYRLVFRGEEKMASIFYAFFNLKGVIRRKHIAFSCHLEKLIANELSVDPFFIRALGQFITPKHSEITNDFLIPLKELMMSHPLISGDFQMKELTSSIFKPELINTINRIIRGQINFDEFFEKEVKEKHLASTLQFLFELKTRKAVNLQNFSQVLEYTLEKYSFDVKEVVDIYNLCKRKEMDLVEAFSDIVKKDTLELLRSFLVAQSKLKLPDSELSKRFLQNNSFLFNLMGFDEKIIWTALLAKRGNFKLMRRFQRSQFRDEAQNGPFLLDLLEEILSLTQRSCQMIRKGNCRLSFCSPILHLNPWIEKLLSLHKFQTQFKDLSQELRKSLSPFSYILFLTLKYSDFQIIEYLFDFQFFKNFGSLVKKFKSEFSGLKGVGKALDEIDAETKERFDLFQELIKNKRLFVSHSKLIRLISPCESEFLHSLLDLSDDTETAYNVAINRHLFTGWRRRVKDETMVTEIDSFLKNTFCKPLQYYMFDPKEAEVESLLQNKTYFFSFLKFLMECFSSTVAELSALDPERGPEPTPDQSDFGSPFFLSIVLFRLGEYYFMEKDNFFEHYSYVLYKTDILFRFIEKYLFSCSQKCLIQKDYLMKQYLFFFGIMLKPQHSLAFSPSIFTPSMFVYLFHLINRTQETAVKSYLDLPVHLSKLPPVKQVELKSRVLSKVLETDRINSRNGQPLQMFRRFSFDPAFQGSEACISFRYTTKLNDGKSLDLSLCKDKFVVDLCLLESFYVLNVLTKGRPENSFLRKFERLNPMRYSQALYEFEILSSALLRKKFRGNLEELFKLFFGYLPTESQRIQNYNLSYYKISLSCKVFDVVLDDVFEYRETALSYHMVDSPTKGILEFVRSLQNQTKHWDLGSFLSVLKSSKIKLKSDLTVLGVIFEYLLSPGLLR